MKSKRINISTASVKEYKYLDNPNSKFKVNKKQYLSISKDFFEELAYLLITTGDIIIFPTSLGAVQAVKYKRKHKKAIDYQATKEYDKKIYHTNMATNGYWCRIHWYRIPKGLKKYGARFRKAKNYSFKLTRPNLKFNTYNKRNPRVCLYSFFKEKGWEFYKEKKL